MYLVFKFEIALVNMRVSLKLYGLEATELFYTNNISDKGFLDKCRPSLLKEVQPVHKYAKYPLYSIPDTVDILTMHILIMHKSCNA